MMKKFEILRELPKCDTETRCEHKLRGLSPQANYTD
jgi:hypothetical protein